MYGKSWDSSCEKSWVQVQNDWVLVQKDNEQQTENVWAFITQLIWTAILQFTEIKTESFRFEDSNVFKYKI